MNAGQGGQFNCISLALHIRSFTIHFIILQKLRDLHGGACAFVDAAQKLMHPRVVIRMLHMLNARRGYGREYGKEASKEAYDAIMVRRLRVSPFACDDFRAWSAQCM